MSKEPEFDFAEFLTEFNYGELNQKLGHELKSVASAVDATGKNGEITLKLVIVKNGIHAMVKPEVKAKVPRDPAEGAAFYFGSNGALMREDPRQVSIDFRTLGVRDNNNPKTVKKASDE